MEELVKQKTPYRDIKCSFCGEMFSPNSPNQKYCDKQRGETNCKLEIRRANGRRNQIARNRRLVAANPNHWKEIAQRYPENPEVVKLRRKKWVESKPEYSKNRYHRNKKEIPDFLEHKAELNRESYYRNRKTRIAAQMRMKRERLKNDIGFRITWTVRGRLHRALKGKIKAHTMVEMLGCTPSQLKEYLESKFTEGMSWENHGTHGWHVDHIRPLSSFDLTDPQQQLIATHHTNLQPLWAKDNLSKSNKII